MKKIGILIFIAAAVFGVLVSSLFSFGRLDPGFLNISFNKKVRGSGSVSTERREVRDFKGVEVSGIFQVEIAAQKDFAVEVEADDNLLPLIRTEVRGGVLHIECEKRISTSKALKVRISAPYIESVDASGVSKIELSGVKNEQLKVDTSGASKIRITGETARLDIGVSGASSVDAEALRAGNASVDASGASSVTVFASGELRTEASGASRITYLGSPKSVQKRTSGASSVREL
jgi:HSP20 family molecular chaperone IbpA